MIENYPIGIFSSGIRSSIVELEVVELFEY